MYLPSKRVHVICIRFAYHTRNAGRKYQNVETQLLYEVFATQINQLKKNDVTCATNRCRRCFRWQCQMQQQFKSGTFLN